MGKFFWGMVFAMGINDSRGVLVNWFLIFSVEKEIATKTNPCIFSETISPESAKDILEL